MYQILKTENHFQAFIFWGIGPGQKEYDDNNISQYNRVWGIGYDDKNAIDDMIQYEQGRYRNIKNKSNSKSRNRRYNSSSTYNHSHGKSYFWPLNNRNKNNIDLKVFNGKELDIDMYLDANKGELKFKIVGNKLTVAEIWKLPIDKDCDGWVPHFNLCEEAQGSELRVAKIPIKWYGKRQKHVDIFSTE